MHHTSPSTSILNASTNSRMSKRKRANSNCPLPLRGTRAPAISRTMAVVLYTAKTSKGVTSHPTTNNWSLTDCLDVYAIYFPFYFQWFFDETSKTPQTSRFVYASISLSQSHEFWTSPYPGKLLLRFNCLPTILQILANSFEALFILRPAVVKPYHTISTSLE